MSPLNHSFLGWKWTGWMRQFLQGVTQLFPPMFCETVKHVQKYLIIIWNVWLLIAFTLLSESLTRKKIAKVWKDQLFWGAKEPFETCWEKKKINEIDCNPCTTEPDCPKYIPAHPGTLEASGQDTDLNWPYKSSPRHLPGSNSLLCWLSKRGC